MLEIKQCFQCISIFVFFEAVIALEWYYTSFKRAQKILYWTVVTSLHILMFHVKLRQKYNAYQWTKPVQLLLQGENESRIDKSGNNIFLI